MHLLAFAALVALAAAPPAEVPVTTKSKEALAAFLQARDAQESSRPQVAEAGFRKAVALDPGFVQAQAYLLYYVTPTEAAALAKQARAAAQALPEAERLLVVSMVAYVDGDEAAALAAERALVEKMPDDWRVRVVAGSRAHEQRRFADAEAHLRRAVELNPRAGGAWNTLGYNHLQQGRLDEALAAFRRFAEVAPHDPNAHDSLGDALLRAGRWAEAEAAFRKAIAADKSFHGAWSGVALARAMQADRKGAVDAVRNMVEAGPRPLDKARAHVQLAVWQAAAGRADDARASMSAAEALMKQQKEDARVPFYRLWRAELEGFLNQPAAALRAVEEARAAAATAPIPEGDKRNFREWAWFQELRAQRALGRKAEAAKTAEALLASLATHADPVEREASMHAARGAALWAAGDVKAAIVELSRCTAFQAPCLAEGAQAAQQAGDAAALAAFREKLAQAPDRGADVVMARAKAGLLP